MEQKDTEEDDYSDVTITVSGQVLRSSKWALARHSAVFKGLFKSCPSTTKMEINNVTLADMELFLTLLNPIDKTKFTLDKDNAVAVLELARKYDALIVVQHCEEYLLQLVQDRTQSAKLVAMADTYNMPKLRQAAILYLSQLDVPTSALVKEELSKCKAETVFNIFDA